MGLDPASVEAGPFACCLRYSQNPWFRCGLCRAMSFVHLVVVDVWVVSVWGGVANVVWVASSVATGVGSVVWRNDVLRVGLGLTLVQVVVVVANWLDVGAAVGTIGVWGVSSIGTGIASVIWRNHVLRVGVSLTLVQVVVVVDSWAVGTVGVWGVGTSVATGVGGVVGRIQVLRVGVSLGLTLVQVVESGWVGIASMVVWLLQVLVDLGSMVLDLGSLDGGGVRWDNSSVGILGVSGRNMWESIVVPLSLSLWLGQCNSQNGEKSNETKHDVWCWFVRMNCLPSK